MVRLSSVGLLIPSNILEVALEEYDEQLMRFTEFFGKITFLEVGNEPWGNRTRVQSKRQLGGSYGM